MAIYSIADLEKLTGIKAHTIRIWEKRYGIISPKRTVTNIRYYDENDLKKVANIAMLKMRGYKISQISEMAEHKVESLVADIADVEVFNTDALDALTLSILKLDESKFIYLINTNIHQLGFDRTFEDIILPLLDKLNGMWLSGCIKKVHEEFVNQIITKKLIHEISKLELRNDNGLPQFLLFLLDGETQILSKYHTEYILRKNHFSVVDIGNQAAEKDIIDAIQIHKPKFVFTILQEQASVKRIQEILNNIETIPDAPVFLLGGYYSSHFDSDHKLVRCFQDFGEFNHFINTIQQLAIINKSSK